MEKVRIFAPTVSTTLLTWIANQGGTFVLGGVNKKKPLKSGLYLYKKVERGWIIKGYALRIAAHFSGILMR